MMVMSGGAASRKLSLDAFVAQANEYEDWEPGWDKLMRFRRELMLTHPFPVRRVHELMKWVRSGDYDRIMGGEYRPPRHARRRARGGRRRRRVLRREVQDDLQGGRRRRRQGRRQGGRRRREALGVAQALAGRTAIVTGGTRGLGLEIARASSRPARTCSSPAATQAALGARELGVTAIRADVADPEPARTSPPARARSPCWSTTPA